MGILLSETTETAGYNPILMIVVWVAILALMMWVMGGSQRKEQKRLNAMLSELQIGDSVLTTSGFYGMVIDISDDTVIVEFGNNKNCRIPMNKTAIAQVEKPGAE
ncbi:MAG: preprotein translocase subunit YajC [Lachnospiraceae bacterium]